MAFSRRLAAVGSAVAGALAAIGLALMGLAHGVSAAPGTARVYPGATPPCNTTLQACISGSAPGDQVNLAAGTYYTTVVITKAVSLIGASAATTIIQPHAVGLRAVLISGTVPPSTQIANLTVRGARLAGGNGAGMLVEAPAQPNLNNLSLQDNVVSGTNAMGGGLFSSSNLTLTQVTLTSNRAITGSGGGLGTSPGVEMTLIGATFSVNQAAVRGGGVFAHSAKIESSVFIANTATAQDGGGAYLTGTAAITGSNFVQNSAGDDGAGAYAGGDVRIERGNFSLNNAAAGSAGAVYAGGNLAINGTFVSANRSLDSGGAIFAGGALTLTNATIAQNQSTGGSGGGVRAAGTALLSGTSVISNSALNPGGGVRVTLDTQLIHSTFVSNTSLESGGGLRVDAGAAITGGRFTANSADEGGGALVLGPASVTGTLFGDNVALFRGGGLDVVTATVRGATFERNRTLDGNGGGLAASNHLTLRDSQFTANEVITGNQAAATGNGGGVFSDGVLTSTNNAFIGNFAHRLGGGMDADDLRSTGDIFRGNGTGLQGSGGGMFVAQAFGIDGAQFFTNGANTAGGLGINSTASGFVINSLFARNTVTFTDGGAAIRLLAASNVLLIHNTIVGVSQPSRAAIHIQGSGSPGLYANIFTHHAKGIVNFSGPPPTTTVTANYNLFFSVPVTGVGTINWGSQNFVADPAFADPARFDFHLLPHSPAINAAPSFGLVFNDFEKQPRPMGGNFDIGFDEALPARLYLPLIVR